VSEATISRDVAAMLAENRIKRCPHCGKGLQAEIALQSELDAAWRLLHVFDERGVSVLDVCAKLEIEPLSEDELEELGLE